MLTYMDTDVIQKSCLFCGRSIPNDASFCPFCGKMIGSKLSTSLSKQILIYSISFFLPPFGLSYAWKYLKQPDKKSRNIGLISIALTIISIIISIVLMEQILNSITKNLNVLSTF